MAANRQVAKDNDKTVSASQDQFSHSVHEMTPQLRLSQHQLTDLASIRDLDLSDFDHAITKLNEAQPRPLHPSQLHSLLRSAIPHADEERIGALIRQLLGLYALVGQFALSEDEVFAGLTSGILNSGNWTKDEIEKWKERERKLRDLFSINSVRLVAKALNLSYEHQNLLRSARIITDIRPVFNADGTEIEGAVVSHNASIRFDNVEGGHTLTVAMDEDDINKLKQQCERALLKAETVKRRLMDNAGLQIIIAGRDEDAAH